MEELQETYKHIKCTRSDTDRQTDILADIQQKHTHTTTGSDNYGRATFVGSSSSGFRQIRTYDPPKTAIPLVQINSVRKAKVVSQNVKYG